MLNYLACLGWNDGTEQEIYSKEDLIKSFSIDRIQNSGARFDEVKIFWYNGQWIRKIATEQGIDELYARTKGFWPEFAEQASSDYKKKVLSIIYDRLKTLSDLKTMTDYFFKDPIINLEEILENKFLKKLEKSELIDLLTKTIDRLETIEDWSEEALQNALNELLVASGKKPAEYFSLIRIAVSFAAFSPALHQTLAVLGKEIVLDRLKAVKTALKNA